ncbi:hypothetical protein GIY30_11440 [Gordonia sp. HNM0687]|uniref:DUF4829 domain-containing protein n=1 Tax=Gordonia mangrovi TaxID=2665643 RepID=A0A6L7GQP7_9ACTN|nr:hypothetical protein [Gordonia mangrovi]MXP21962.1 hypothetical protein [Gordonia mangrovi]UVF76321.1 hypothetical protein NWF22_13060 [Gordonia mangrovi]
MAIAALVVILGVAVVHFTSRDSQSSAPADTSSLESAVQQVVQQLRDKDSDALLSTTCGQLRMLVENGKYDPLDTSVDYVQNLWRGPVTTVTDFHYHSTIDTTAIVYARLEYAERVDSSIPWPVVRFALQRNTTSAPWQVCGAQTTL